MNIEDIAELLRKVVLTTKKPFLRCSKVRMYYSSTETLSTPTPFCEFRVFLITQEAGNFDRYLDTSLNRLEWIFQSIKDAVEKQTAEFEIFGSEDCVEIDPDEVALSFATTDLSPNFWGTNEIYRYVAFFNKNGKIKKDYNETEITAMEAKRSDDYRQWVLEMKKSGMWEDRRIRRREKQLEDRRKELEKRRILGDMT